MPIHPPSTLLQTSNMSGFASLLNQFKETTQAATASGGGKRSRSSYESSSSQNNNEQLAQKSKICHPPPTPPPTTTYCYPSSVPVKTIYIACPANTETGGPEALHQLCHMLNTGEYYYDNAEESNNTDDNTRDEFGRLITSNHNQVDSEGKQQHKLKAYMLYLRERSTGKKSSVEQVFGDSRRSPRPTKYNKYNAPMADHRFPCSQQPTTSLSGADYSSDLVIWPECWTHLIDSLQSLHQQKYQIAIWWLSVNNNKGRFTQDQFTMRKDILHLVQSTYAREYVESKLSLGDSQTRSDVKDNMKQQHGHVLTLTEFIPYTSSEFELASIPIATEAAKPTTTVGADDNKESKSNLVVYNPAKGMHFTDEIIRRACGKHAKTESDGSVSGGGIRFCPIGKGPGGRERMTGEEVVGLLKKAKVYIDFGPHPGMDRLPREAALAGCVVITNREGAANYDKDVPLPVGFKFGDFNVDKIFSLIKECCIKHEEYAKQMDKYKTWILGQRVQMKICVDEMVNHVAKRADSSK